MSTKKKPAKAPADFLEEPETEALLAEAILRLASKPARVEAVRRVLECSAKDARAVVRELEHRRTEHYRELGTDGRRAETRALLLRSVGEAAMVHETATVAKLLGTLEQMERDRGTPGRSATKREAPENMLDWTLSDAETILRDAKAGRLQ